MSALLKNNHKVLFHGEAWEYFKIWMVNIVLTVLTLGIYAAWATVRTRRYFYKNTEINGRHFDYHASPLKILFERIILGIFLVTITITLQSSSSSINIIGIVILLMSFAAFPFMLIRRWRYDASMTSFSKHRFNYAININWGYRILLVLPVLSCLFLCVIYIGFQYIFIKLSTIGVEYIAIKITALLILVLIFLILLIISTAIFKCEFYRLYINNLMLIEYKFNTEIKLRGIIKIFFYTALILIVPIGIFLFVHLLMIVGIHFSLVGLSFFGTDNLFVKFFPAIFLFSYLMLLVSSVFAMMYYRMHIRNYVYSNTTLENKIMIRSNINRDSYIELMFTNVFIILLSLGLAIPQARIRYRKYLAEHTEIEGDLDNLFKNN